MIGRPAATFWRRPALSPNAATIACVGQPWHSSVITRASSSAGLCSRENGVLLVSAKGPLAPPTPVSLRRPTVDHDVSPARDTALRTVRVVAALLLRVHQRPPDDGM